MRFLPWGCFFLVLGPQSLADKDPDTHQGVDLLSHREQMIIALQNQRQDVSFAFASVLSQVLSAMVASVNHIVDSAIRKCETHQNLVLRVQAITSYALLHVVETVL